LVESIKTIGLLNIFNRLYFHYFCIQFYYQMKNKKTVVLGASTKPDRYSFKAITMLVDKGHTVIAIGQNTGEVAGVKIYTKAIPLSQINTVSLYLNPARQRDYYNYIVEAKPKRVIFNPGTENPEFYQLLKLNNIKVEIACTLVLLTTNQY
jgi:predicted CoA-binding protein